MTDIVERLRAYDSLRDTTSSDKAIRREWGPQNYKIVTALEQGAKAEELMMQVEELMRDIEELMTAVRFLRIYSNDFAQEYRR
jgi:hypothetical protein